MNEHGEICDWRLTKTTAFDEIEDLLMDLRDRLSLHEQGIETICIDVCCKNRKYQNIFPNANVKIRSGRHLNQLLAPKTLMSNAS